MIVCIDSGNSRIKWGVHDGARWIDTGAVPHADIGRLAGLTSGPYPTTVMIANVAGETVAAHLLEVLHPWQDRCRWAASAVEACDVHNLYENPAQLGVDRWCALIGARHRVASACLVVMCGTATTIDSLNADGHFLGGLILPGFDLMRRSLARDTAALPLADGVHADFPRRTADAITSGCLEAQAGAIERAFARLATPDAHCLISGGNAARLSPLLGIPFTQVDNLVLDGLLKLAEAPAP